jgi:hypothetical protein
MSPVCPVSPDNLILCSYYLLLPGDNFSKPETNCLRNKMCPGFPMHSYAHPELPETLDTNSSLFIANS